MRSAILIAAPLALPLAACQSPQNGTYGVQGASVELGSQQIVQVMRGVTPSLKDPGAAQFGSIKASKLAIGQGADARQGYAVCGEVSSRASFGTETMVPFVGGFKSDLREFRLLVLGGPADKSTAVIKACRQAGIPFDRPLPVKRLPGNVHWGQTARQTSARRRLGSEYESDNRIETEADRRRTMESRLHAVRIIEALAAQETRRPTLSPPPRTP